MNAQPVQSVFFWRAEMMSVFKAIYGRKPDGTTYTKDFHQPRGEQARALERALQVPLGGQGPVEWRWPGGHDAGGKLFAAADFGTSSGRMNLRWTTDRPPAPWHLTERPDESTVATLRGNPDLTSEVDANAQLTAIVASGEAPWLIAVHLHGEGPILHARVVLENPEPGREFASWDNLPEAVRREMRSLRRNTPGSYVEFEEGYVVRSGATVGRILRAFDRNPNVLLVGPPGTGKTVAMDDIRRAFVEGKGVTFDPDRLHGAFDESVSSPPEDTRVKSLVFHPSYTYEDFVMGLLPEPTEVGVGVAPKVGPLLELADFASTPGRRALLICDEFNRGAAASIFGDTLALLDVDKRSTPGAEGTGASIETPYAHLHPQTHDREVLPAVTSLPSSLFVLAAMNSADRSVAPLDAALRRRFSIIYVAPDYDVLREHLRVADEFVLAKDPVEWTTADHIAELAVELLEAINERIEAISGRDFQLGQSVMWHVNTTSRTDALRSLAAAMDDRVIGTLALSYVDNDDELAAVLAVDPAGEGSAGGAATWHTPDPRIAHVASRRLRPTRFQDLQDGPLLAALASLL